FRRALPRSRSASCGAAARAPRARGACAAPARAGWKNVLKTPRAGCAARAYVLAVVDLIRPYVPRRFVALGTDGFGRSDTRAALRAFFEVDARNIAVAALAALQSPLLPEALRRYGIDPGTRPPWER